VTLDQLGIINRLPYPTKTGVAPQIGAYNALLAAADGQNEWLGFIDADEFITPLNYEEGLNDLIALLKKDDISAVALNWAVYGSSCSIIPENKLVIERLNKRANKDHPVNLHYKSIVRKRDTLSAGNNPHEFSLYENKNYFKTTGVQKLENNGLSKQVDWDKARINHYVIKSKAEFITKKVARGRATTLEKQLNRTLNFFRSHDLNDVEDNFPRWFIHKVENEKQLLINKLKSVNYRYREPAYPLPLYRTASGMGKGHIDNLKISEVEFEIRGWAINKNNDPVEDIIAVINSVHVMKCKKLTFRNRMDLARAGLGNGMGSGFNAAFNMPESELLSIDIYGLDTNGLVVVEIKSNINIIDMINDCPKI